MLTTPTDETNTPPTTPHGMFGDVLPATNELLMLRDAALARGHEVARQAQNVLAAKHPITGSAVTSAQRSLEEAAHLFAAADEYERRLAVARHVATSRTDTSKDDRG